MKCLQALVAFILVLALASSSFARAESVELTTNLVVSFASIEAGSKSLKQRDDFIAALTPFERAARMVTNRPVSEAEFLTFISTNVVAWTPEEIDGITTILQGVGRKLAPWQLPFPAAILLIKTTGREEIEADYTRENTIIMPVGMVRSVSPSIILHELFHVLSRHNPALREKLYGLIGFQRINEVEIPAELLPRKWTNPDGVQNGWRIAITNRNQEVSAVPGLYAPANFDYTKAVNPFSFFRLLVITNAAGQWTPRLVDGHPQLLSVREVQGFNEQIGANTRYVIHPDEILADNFVQLINARTNLPTPRIIDGMKEIFAAHQ